MNKYILNYNVKFQGLNLLNVVHSQICDISTRFHSTNEISDVEISKAYLSNLDLIERDRLIITDKRIFIFHNFLLDHPHTLVDNWNQLEYLLQEKSSFRSWFDECKTKWSLLNDIPEWLVSDPNLRELWVDKYQSSLVVLRQRQMSTIEANNKARLLYEETIALNNKQLATFEDKIYFDNPVIMIHKVNPSALPEAELLKLHSLNKEQRRDIRKDLINQYRKDLLDRFTKGDLSLQELIDLVK